MGHNFYLSEDSCIVDLIATLLIVILLSIIAFMLLHIEQQDETISKLNMKVSKMEQAKMEDKDAVRIMCWKELFERIDNYHKKARP